jgi:hypothetical protein
LRNPGIEARKLRWFGHVMRMPEERWPAIIHSGTPPGRRKSGRPKRSWWDGVTKAMKKRGMSEEDAQAPDTLEERIGKAADSRINPYIRSTSEIQKVRFAIYSR